MCPCSGWDVVGSESSIGVLRYGGCVRVSVCAPCPTLYDSHESMDDIWYVNGMFAVLLACIHALVWTWLVQNRVLVVVGLLYVRTVVRVCPFIFSLESTDDICYIVLIYAMVDLLINFSTVNFVCFIN